MLCITLLLSVAFCVCVAEGTNALTVQEKQNRIKHSELFLSAFTVKTEVMFIATSDRKGVKGCLDKRFCY